MLPDRPEDSGLQPVRYLSQQFVERLCAHDGVSTELVDEIERVVFTHWPANDRLGATTFKELLELRLRSSREGQDSAAGTVRELSRQIADQRVIKAGLTQKSLELAAVKTASERLTAEGTELTKQAHVSVAMRKSSLVAS